MKTNVTIIIIPMSIVTATTAIIIAKAPAHSQAITHLHTNLTNNKKMISDIEENLRASGSHGRRRNRLLTRQWLRGMEGGERRGGRKEKAQSEGKSETIEYDRCWKHAAHTSLTFAPLYQSHTHTYSPTIFSSLTSPTHTFTYIYMLTIFLLLHPLHRRLSFSLLRNASGYVKYVCGL